MRGDYLLETLAALLLLSTIVSGLLNQSLTSQFSEKHSGTPAAVEVHHE